jgi:hypothetical protein
MFHEHEGSEQIPGEGRAFVHGNRHAAIAMRWRQNFATAESVRRGAPSGKLDFSNASPEALETFLRNINATAAPWARGLVESADFSSIKTLLDVGLRRRRDEHNDYKAMPSRHGDGC